LTKIDFSGSNRPADLPYPIFVITYHHPVTIVVAKKTPLEGRAKVGACLSMGLAPRARERLFYSNKRLHAPRPSGACVAVEEAAL
jgi:hypothetical protein